MKKTIKNLALLPLFCGLLLTSACSDNYDNGNKNKDGERLLPSRIFSVFDGNELNLLVFSYDEQNRITRVISRDMTYEITYNTDGTVATIRGIMGNWEVELSTFVYSGNTIRRIRDRGYRDGVDTFHFEINDRGQVVRKWYCSRWDGCREYSYTHNTIGNIVRRIVAITCEERGEGEFVVDFEYSLTARAVFRNISTPEWVLQGNMLFDFEGELFVLTKHGFVPTKFRLVDDEWVEKAIVTYTAENGWVQTMRIYDGYDFRTIHIEYINAR